MVGQAAAPSANAVEAEYQSQIGKGWTEYLERTTGEQVTAFNEDDHDTIRDLRFIRSPSIKAAIS